MYIYQNHVSPVSGSLTISGTDPSSTIASETKISNKNNERNINNIGAIDESELPIRFRRATILTEEIQYIEVCDCYVFLKISLLSLSILSDSFVY